MEINRDKLDNLHQQLIDVIRQGDARGAKQMVSKLHPVDAARLTALLNEAERQVLFQVLSSGIAADIVERMNESDQINVVSALEPDIASDIIEQMDSDEAADVLGDLPPEKTDAILAAMPTTRAVKTRELIAYPEDTAGGIMATEFIALKETQPVRAAIKTLRAKYARLGDERAAYVYTVDRAGVLTGVLQLRHLVTRQVGETLENIKIRNVKSVSVGMNKYEVAQFFRRYKYLALPVVDEESKMVGVITADDVVDLTQEIATEEMLKLQGVATDETRAMSLINIVRRRVSWLSINIFLNVIAASVIAFYTDTLKAVIALAVFLPIISDMSGVSGMQAVAVSIRDLALGRTSSRELWKVLWKESRIGFFNGLILGTEIGLVAYLWKGMAWLGLVVAVSLWINTILSVCLGSSLPLILKRFNIDPAIASGPMLTTVTDLMGFLIVLSLATRFIHYLQ
ncbi:magnesium transporter [bacterium]|nr:magnesium transporter [bacterium]